MRILLHIIIFSCSLIFLNACGGKDSNSASNNNYDEELKYDNSESGSLDSGSDDNFNNDNNKGEQIEADNNNSSSEADNETSESNYDDLKTDDKDSNNNDKNSNTTVPSNDANLDNQEGIPQKNQNDTDEQVEDSQQEEVPQETKKDNDELLEESSQEEPTPEIKNDSDKLLEDGQQEEAIPESKNEDDLEDLDDTDNKNNDIENSDSNQEQDSNVEQDSTADSTAESNNDINDDTNDDANEDFEVVVPEEPEQPEQNEENTPSISLTDVIVHIEDGLLDNAIVCIDEDLDFKCDASSEEIEEYIESIRAEILGVGDEGLSIVTNSSELSNNLLTSASVSDLAKRSKNTNGPITFTKSTNGVATLRLADIDSIENDKTIGFLVYLLEDIVVDNIFGTKIKIPSDVYLYGYSQGIYLKNSSDVYISPFTTYATLFVQQVLSDNFKLDQINITNNNYFALLNADRKNIYNLYQYAFYIVTNGLNLGGCAYTISNNYKEDSCALVTSAVLLQLLEIPTKLEELKTSVFEGHLLLAELSRIARLATSEIASLKSKFSDQNSDTNNDESFNDENDNDGENTESKDNLLDQNASYTVVAINNIYKELQGVSITQEPMNVSFSYDGSNYKSVAFSNETTSFLDRELTYYWDFGDNSSISNEVNPIHKYKTPGVYSVILKVSDGENVRFYNQKINTFSKLELCSREDTSTKVKVDIFNINGHVYAKPVQVSMGICNKFYGYNYENIKYEIDFGDGKTLLNDDETYETVENKQKLPIKGLYHYYQEPGLYNISVKGCIEDKCDFNSYDIEVDIVADEAFDNNLVIRKFVNSNESATQNNYNFSIQNVSKLIGTKRLQYVIWITEDMDTNTVIDVGVSNSNSILLDPAYSFMFFDNNEHNLRVTLLAKNMNNELNKGVLEFSVDPLEEFVYSKPVARCYESSYKNQSSSKTSACILSSYLYNTNSWGKRFSTEVSWGDGSVEKFMVNNIMTHKYTINGNYKVSFYIRPTSNSIETPVIHKVETELLVDYNE